MQAEHDENIYVATFDKTFIQESLHSNNMYVIENGFCGAKYNIEEINFAWTETNIIQGAETIARSSTQLNFTRESHRNRKQMVLCGRDAKR